MRFEARDLKPYKEVVAASDLVVGRVYFKVSYHDQDMVVPELTPIVFVGRDLHPQGPGFYYQDVTSYLAGKRFDLADLAGAGVFPLEADAHGLSWGDDDFTFEFERDGMHSDVCEFDEALNQLLSCSLRRASWNGRIRPFGADLDGE